MPNANELERQEQEQQEYTGPVHYYAACAVSWATADTREQAVEKCLRHAGLDMVKRSTLALHKEGKPGFYVWSCKVHAPSDAPYRIEWYAPKGVDWSESKQHNVTYATQKAVKFTTERAR